MAQSTQTTSSNNFDFKVYNDLMKSANSGLQLYLALQNLQNVEQTFRRFNSPFAKEIIDIVDELNDIRNRNKAYLAKRENSGNTEALDNASLPGGSLTQPSNSADAGKVSA
jgi:hypothetical protein